MTIPETLALYSLILIPAWFVWWVWPRERKSRWKINTLRIPLDWKGSE